MHRITLTIILLLSATCADAASYEKINGTIVDPIQSISGGDHPYSGANLELGADLTGADLSGAVLHHADLYNANLSYANLYEADLYYAVLEEADLTGADLSYADLYEAELDEADLSGSILTFARYYDDAIWTDAFYYTDNEPTWDSGMDAAWRSSVGILAVAPTSAVPEPSALLLALLGLALLPRKRRR